MREWLFWTLTLLLVIVTSPLWVVTYAVMGVRDFFTFLKMILKWRKSK